MSEEDNEELESGNLPGYHPFRPPFRYEDVGQKVFDADNNTVLDVRGWGYLKGALNLLDDEAAKLQDRVGLWVVEAMNKHVGYDAAAEYEPPRFVALWKFGEGRGIGIGATMEQAVNDYLIKHSGLQLAADGVQNGTIFIEVFGTEYDPQPKQEEDDWNEPGSDYVLGPEAGHARYMVHRLTFTEYRHTLLSYSPEMDASQLIDNAPGLNEKEL